MQTQEKWQRALQSGGMLLVQKDKAIVYRGQDARRSQMCEIGLDKVEPLLAAGALRALGGQEGRWVWSGQSRKIVTRDFERPPIAPRRRKAPAKSVLEFILRAEKNPARQVYLASAANRFRMDMEASMAGRSMTMNWDFVPRGKNRASSDTAGFSVLSHNAHKGICNIRAVLSVENMRFIEAVLISRRTLIQLAHDFSIRRNKLAGHGVCVLAELARAYDLVVPREQN